MNLAQRFEEFHVFAQWLRNPVTEVQRAQRNALILLLGATLTLLPHFFHLPPLIWVTTSLLLLGRAWLTLKNQPGPRGIWLVVFAIVLGGAIWQEYGTMVGREAGVASLVLLAGFKLLEMRARRDLFVVVFLCFFLLLTQFLNEQSFVTFLTGCGALVVLVSALMLFHSGNAPASTLRAAMKDSLRTLAMAAPLAVLAFFLFPRIAGPLWSMPGDAFAGKTGLSDTMTPGQISKLVQSDEIALRIKFDGAMPPVGQRYFRGPVLTRFDGRTWRGSDSIAQNLLVSIPPDAQPVRQEITMEASQYRWLFALEQPISLPMVDQQQAMITRDATLLNVQPVREKIRYTVSSLPSAQLQLSNNRANVPLMRQVYVDLPQGFNPRALQWAAELRRQLGSDEVEPQVFVNAIMAHFRTQPFRYTLEPPALPRDTVDAFFFDTRAGFCEHYAQTFVVLMRAMDFPARVVTGYQGGEVNEFDGLLTIRQLDAHAWAEVYSPTRGWIRVDPTAAVAPERVERGMTASFPERAGAFGSSGAQMPQWLLRLRNYSDAAGTFWSQWVVGYSAERQREFFRNMGLQETNWSQLAWVLVAAAGVGMGLIWLWTRPRKPAPQGAAKLRAQLVKATSASGLAPLPEEGLQSWVARVTPGLAPQQARQLHAIAALLEKLAYAPAEAAQQQLLQREFYASLRGLKRQSMANRS
jgi:protein-glutamine gamma-glutamyltransferase